MVQNPMRSLSKFRKYYAACFQPLLKRLALTQLEADILLFLCNNPAFNTARDIVELRGFAKSNVSIALDRLRNAGFLTMQTDPDNRRIRRIRLLPEKQAVLRELQAQQQICFSRLTDGFTPQEQAQLEQFLLRMEENIPHGV